ncbi:MAG: transporter suffix domain-containing protein [Endomicrobiales bacterium]
MEKKKPPVLLWLGLGLVVFAQLFIPVLLLMPFLPLTLKQKAILTTVLVVGGQVIMWTGILLAGKEVVQKYRGRLMEFLRSLNPRNRRK